jgi:hypothetical protein
VSGKRLGSRSVAAGLIAIAGAGCAVAGALSLWATRNNGPEARGPPLWFFVALAIGSIAFAIRAIADRARIWWALLALLASVLSLVTFWTVGLLSAGGG